MSTEILLLLVLGMANGLLHALDADHILAVSAVAFEGDSRRRNVLRTSACWALGHGGALALLVTLAVGFEWAIPELVSTTAELLVGVILMAVGSSILWQLWRGRIRISHHRHEGLPSHLHLHDHRHLHRSDHRPVLVGVVHGVAGSAPLLAVLPLIIKSQLVFASLYILLFSASVAVMMCLFGGMLGSLVNTLGNRFRHGVLLLQSLLGIQAFAFGGFWILRAI
jgi:hypothetical protein